MIIIIVSTYVYNAFLYVNHSGTRERRDNTTKEKEKLLTALLLTNITEFRTDLKSNGKKLLWYV